MKWLKKAGEFPELINPRSIAGGLICIILIYSTTLYPAFTIAAFTSSEL